MYRLQGEGWPGRWRALHLVAGAFIAVWLSACGGGGGGDVIGAVNQPPTGGEATPDASGDAPQACPNDGDMAAKALDACGGPDLICLGDFDGATAGNLVPLTSGDWPAWSPDRLRIAFHRTSEGSESHIFLIDSDGTGEQLLVAGKQPSWSPDGMRITFTSSEGISVMNDDGTGMTTLIRHGALRQGYLSVHAPAWSPDGERIAFVGQRDPDADVNSLFVMNSDGSQPRRVTPVQERQWNEDFPVWSPTGDRIAFNRPFSAIATVDAAGGEPRLLVRGIAEFSRAAWSPLGANLAFTANSRCGPNPAIHVVDRAGGATQTLIRHAREPAWSPDGARIAFVTLGDDATFQPSRDFPAVAGPAEVFVREHPDSFGSLSRYVLFEDGRFELQYLSTRWGFFSYAGSYTRSGSGLTFSFADNATQWGATGFLEGDRMIITYNFDMLLSDFEDGVYVRMDG